jgi:hypothetical protein
METRAELHQAIDQLDDEQTKEVMVVVQSLLNSKIDILERLKKVPDIRLPANWPPRFERVQPVKLEGEGELASEQLIRERR